MCLERRHLPAVEIDLELLGVRVEDRHEQARLRVVALFELAAAVRHHEPQRLRVGRGERQVVRAVDGDRRVEGLQALHARVAAALERARVVPAAVEQVDVAARRERHRHEHPRHVVRIERLDDQPRGDHVGTAAEPCIVLVLLRAPLAVHAIPEAVLGVRNLAMRLPPRAARRVVQRRERVARRAGGVGAVGPELALVTEIEDHSVANVGRRRARQLPPARRRRHARERARLGAALARRRRRLLLSEAAVCELEAGPCKFVVRRHVPAGVGAVVERRRIEQHLPRNVVPCELRGVGAALVHKLGARDDRRALAEAGE